MTEQVGDVPWEGQCADAAYEFGLRCANLVAQNPYHVATPLSRIVNGFMTELWDRNFSQSEIRTAFGEAIRDMLRWGGAAKLDIHGIGHR
jgi:hypothetical protein